MAKVKLKHPDLTHHDRSIMVRMRKFWMEGHLCDVVVKSRDGGEHRAHTNVLSAASIVLETLLGGPFREADWVRRGKPIPICASDACVVALLDYIYGGQPEVHLEDSIELLRLADAYDLPQLAEAIHAGFRESAPLATALKMFQELEGLPGLKAACADRVALNFKACAQHPGFLQLSPTQLGEILQRDDLNVPREDAVLQGIWKWLNESKDRHSFLGLLLMHVDFPSISFKNLVRIDNFAASIGPKGRELQLEVDKALQTQKKRSCSEIGSVEFLPKRRCLHHWSPHLGASSAGPQQVLARVCKSLRWHQGFIYATTDDNSDSSSVLCWKPGETDPRVVAGEGASVAGLNDLSSCCTLDVTLAGEIFVTDFVNKRLIRFANGAGELVIGDFERGVPRVSPNGVIYLVQDNAFHKLVGTTLQPVTGELPFQIGVCIVTKEEVVYFEDADNGRILRIGPGEPEPAVAGEITGGPAADIRGMSVSEEDTIYISDWGQSKVWAFYPGDTTCMEVLQCPKGLPYGIVARDGTLYVSMGTDEDIDGAVYEYALPPKLHLE
eukprot:Skav232334  [mRNA]  locus=scaffold1704:246636:248297:+ [translate_table: standard]